MNDAQTKRTRAHLSQLSKGRMADLERLFAPGRVMALLAGDVVREPQAQACFCFAVNLLARLHPVIQELEVVIPNHVPVTTRLPKWGAAQIDTHVRELLQSLNPPLSWSVVAGPSRQFQMSLIVGHRGSGGPLAEHTVFVGSQGWEALISPHSVVPVGGPSNPVGAYAAACLGVAEVWKRLLYPHRALLDGTPVIPLETCLRFSTFTYIVGEGQSNPALEPSLDLDRLTMVGLGAGGGATLFTLASLPGLKGIINLVDPDPVDEPNLNRYVFADSLDASRNTPKTEVLRGLLAQYSEVAPRALPFPFAETRSILSSSDFRHVAAAVHSREARREIQYETPMILWDAGATGDGEFRIWRMVLARTECMFCKHPPGQEDPDRLKAEQLARLLGLDRAGWLRKLRDNEPFSDEEIRTIQIPGGMDIRPPRPGQPFGDWEQDQCGRLSLPELDDEVPAPFAPVLAGVLIAGEIIKEHQFPGATLDSRYWNTLMGKFLRNARPHRRTPRPDCRFCNDPDYLAQYRRRWIARSKGQQAHSTQSEFI